MALSLIFSVCALATEAETRLSEAQPENFNERLEYALQGTVTGMLMVFAVLTLLTLILYLSKVIFYDIPHKKDEKRRAKEGSAVKPVTPAPAEEAPIAPQTDDTELVAVITAAIAAMLESEEYKDEFKSGFRVVSFKKAGNSGAWNKK